MAKVMRGADGKIRRQSTGKLHRGDEGDPCCCTCRPEPRCLGYDVTEAGFVWPPLAEYLGVTTVENVETVDFEVYTTYSISGGTFTKTYWQNGSATATASVSISSRATSMISRPPSLFTGCVAYGWAHNILRDDGTDIDVIDTGDKGLPFNVTVTLNAMPTSWSDGTTDYETRNFAQNDPTTTNPSLVAHNCYVEATLGATEIEFFSNFYGLVDVPYSYEIRQREDGGEWSAWTLVRGKFSVVVQDWHQYFPSGSATQTFSINRDLQDDQQFTLDGFDAFLTYTIGGTDSYNGITSITSDDYAVGDITFTLRPTTLEDPQMLGAPRLVEVAPDPAIVSPASPYLFEQVCYDVSASCPTNFALDRVWASEVWTSYNLELRGDGVWRGVPGTTKTYNGDPGTVIYLGSTASPVSVTVAEVAGDPVMSVTADTSAPNCDSCPATINLAVDGTGYEELNGNYALAQTGDDCIWTLSVDGTTVTLDTINGGQTWRLFLDGPTQEVEFRAVRTCVCPLRSDWIVQAPGVGTAITS